MNRRALGLTVIVIVTLSGAAVVGVANVGDTQFIEDSLSSTPLTFTDEQSNISITQAFELTPEQRGELDVRVSVSIPDRAENFKLLVPANATVTATDGFEAGDDGYYKWTKQDTNPTISYELDANQTVKGQGPERGEGTYLFADAGSWAMVHPPRPTVSYSWRGDQMGLDRTLAVQDEGVAGEALVFLGPTRTYTRAANGQTFELVIPEAATLEAPPEEILDVFGNASKNFHVGHRDDEVLIVATPTSVDWAVRGLQVGDSDMWVQADEPLNIADNTWLHEYVHSRQDLNTTESTAWLIEATATYHAADLAMRDDLTDFESLERMLERGNKQSYDDVILTDPSTWTYYSQYDRGALVAGELDRQIRLSTNRSRKFERVFARLNQRDSEFGHRVFLETVADVSDSDVRELADQYSTTTDVPDMWNHREHEEAFGPAPATFTYAIPGANDYEIDSEYRNQSAPELPQLAVGEQLKVPVTITNIGANQGTFEAEMTVDDAVRKRVSDELGPGESTTVRFTHTFKAAGTYRLQVDSTGISIEVLEPAQATIREVRTNRSTLEEPGSVTVTAEVENDDSIPGRATVAFTRNETTLGTTNVSLGPRETRAISENVTLPNPGTYLLGANDQNVTVTVNSPGDQTADGPTGVAGPGFGALLALVAIVLTIAVIRRP